MEAPLVSPSFLPSYVSGFEVKDSDIVMNRLSLSGRVAFATYARMKRQEIDYQEITPSENSEESNYLSSMLGVDESIRKLILEIMPKSIKGVIISNEHRGVLIVISKPVGGISGRDGVIRSVEYVYKMDKNPTSSRKLVIIPMVFEEDYEQYPEAVVDVVREFSNMIMKEIQIINNKRFDNIFSVYEEVRDSLESLGSYVEDMNRKIVNQFAMNNIDGLLSNEYPLLRIQTILESVKSTLETFQQV